MKPGEIIYVLYNFLMLWDMCIIENSRSKGYIREIFLELEFV